MTTAQPLTRAPYVVLFDLKLLNEDRNWQVCTVCMLKKEPQKPPEHTSKLVKSQNFLGACPQTPLHTIYSMDPTFFYLSQAPTILSVALYSGWLRKNFRTRGEMVVLTHCKRGGEEGMRYLM